jgi:hypothetical protein
MNQLSIAFTAQQLSWLRSEAKRLGITMGELMRRLIDEKRVAK